MRSARAGRMSEGMRRRSRRFPPVKIVHESGYFRTHRGVRRTAFRARRSRRGPGGRGHGMGVALQSALGTLVRGGRLGGRRRRGGCRRRCRCAPGSRRGRRPSGPGTGHRIIAGRAAGAVGRNLAQRNSFLVGSVRYLQNMSAPPRTAAPASGPRGGLVTEWRSNAAAEKPGNGGRARPDGIRLRRKSPGPAGFHGLSHPGRKGAGGLTGSGIRYTIQWNSLIAGGRRK
jgi:hypothetical protein